MNKNEKSAVTLMLILFAIGLAARYVPWSLPEIGETAVVLPLASESRVLPAFESPLTGIVSSDSLIATVTPIIDSSLQINESVGGESGSETKGKSHKAKKPPKQKIKLPVAINSASAEALCAIPGVGPKLAEKIIEFKKAHGPIKNESELKKIPGIGDKKSKKLLPNIIFDYF